MRDAGACVKGVFDPLADGVVLAVGAVQVDLMQCLSPRGSNGVPVLVQALASCADRRR